MKDQYITPAMEIDRFTLCEIVTDSETDPTTPPSGGVGDMNNDAGEL